MYVCTVTDEAFCVLLLAYTSSPSSSSVFAVSSASTLHGRGPFVGGNPVNPPVKANLSKNQKKRLKKKLKKQQQKEDGQVQDRDKEDSDRTEDVHDEEKEEKEVDQDELPAAIGEGRRNGYTAGSISGSSMESYSTPVSTEGQSTAQKMTADKQRDGTGMAQASHCCMSPWHVYALY